MTVGKISVLVIILVSLFIGYRLWMSTEPEIELVTNADLVQLETKPNSVVDTATVTVPESDVPEVELMDKPGCLTVAQLEEHPELRREAERADAVSTSGAALTSYENLTEETLHGFANQGDAAAMVVLGAINVMRAYGRDDSQAIAWLNRELTIPDFSVGTNELPGDASLALNEAAYWFYEAASHGRVMALQRHGEVKHRLFGGPVGLGWVSQEAYDAMASREKRTMHPSILYWQLSYDVLPELRESGLTSIEASEIPVSRLQIEIRERLRIEFDQGREDRDLPPLQIATATTMSFEDLVELLCDSAKQELNY